MYDRLITLIGKEKFELLTNTSVLIIGIGGVGGYALETLIRSGIKNITIIDYDKIEISNLNRQIITNQKNIGKYKVNEAKKRAKQINPDVDIKGFNIKLDENNIEDFLNYDYIIDACDDLDVKYLLMKYSTNKNYKLISCMGTAKKNHPEMLEITTLDKTSYDPLARLLRNKIKKDKINKKIMVVSSKEQPCDGLKLGSNSFVPATAGIMLASYVYNDIIT